MFHTGCPYRPIGWVNNLRFLAGFMDDFGNFYWGGMFPPYGIMRTWEEY